MDTPCFLHPQGSLWCRRIGQDPANVAPIALQSGEKLINGRRVERRLEDACRLRTVGCLRDLVLNRASHGRAGE